MQARPQVIESPNYLQLLNHTGLTPNFQHMMLNIKFTNANKNSKYSIELISAIDENVHESFRDAIKWHGHGKIGQVVNCLFGTNDDLLLTASVNSMIGVTLRQYIIYCLYNCIFVQKGTPVASEWKKKVINR